MKRTSILIVDDHMILMAGIKSLLRAEKGLEVIGEASTGKDAICKNNMLKPDLILLDISLPDMNGIEAAEKILADTPTTKVLVLTMHESEEFLQEMLKAGVRGYLVKKAADKELLYAIRSVARGNIYVHSSMAKLVQGYNRRKLSKREMQVLSCLADGNVNKEIAYKLGINVRTVDTYRYRVSKKLNIYGRFKLTEYARKTGLISM